MTAAPTLYDPYNRPIASSRPRPIVVGPKRHYEQADPSHLTADWIFTSQTADESIKAGGVRLRNKCRSLERENPYMRRFLTLLKVYVFGYRGIRIECKCRHERRRDRPHEELNDAIKEQWNEFGELGNYDVTGKFSCRTGDIFALRRCVVDGEIFIRLVRGFPDNPWHFAVQFIEADWIDIDYQEKLNNGNVVRMGIEFNQWDRPVAYWITEKGAGISYPSVNGARGKRIRIDAADIIHLGIFERSPQSRCVPWPVAAINNLRQFGEYEAAEVVTARVCSSKMGMIERSMDSVAYTGATEDPKGNLVSEVAAGVIELLDPGQKFVPFDPGQPKSEFATFRKAFLRGISCAFDVGYNALASDLEGVNYSSLRHGQKDDVEVYREIQQWFISVARWRIFSAWLEMATLSGKIDVDSYGFEDIPMVENAIKWNPRGFHYVDPLKDGQSDLLLINNKLETRTGVLARRGEDIEDVFETLEYEEDLAEEHGLDLTPVGTQGKSGGAAGAAGNGGAAEPPPPRSFDRDSYLQGIRDEGYRRFLEVNSRLLQPDPTARLSKDSRPPKAAVNSSNGNKVFVGADRSNRT